MELMFLTKKNKKSKKITAKVTMVATGGAGHVYKTPHESKIATGDGIAFCSQSSR